MAFILKMAWRNVWRNGRRSGITIAAMTLALVVELLYAGLVTGLVRGMEEDATAYELGDLQLLPPGALTRPSLHLAVEDPAPLLAALEGAGFRATPRLFAGGLAAAGELSSGASFVGVDPAREAAAMELHLAMSDGAWLDPADPAGVVVGRGLARVLDLDVGDELLVLSQAADGGVANDLFRVRGVLFPVAAGLDRGGVVMVEDRFRELFAFPSGAHRILARRPVGEGLLAAADRARALAPPEVDVKTWKQLQPMLAQYIDSVAGVVVVLYLIVYLAVGILILNAMLMAVFERIREFGVLKALGYGPGQVFGMLVAEALVQAAVATALGALIAAPGMIWLQTVGIDVGTLGGLQMAGLTMPAVWKGYYTWATVRVPVFMLFGIAFAAVLWPASKAAWIQPVEAMRHT